MIKLILGFLLFVFGILFGAYVGIWWAFIGGIILFIKAFQADPINATWIAYGIARVIFSGLLGWLSAVVCILPSLLLIAKGIDEL